jgi:hypothetical protein
MVVASTVVLLRALSDEWSRYRAINAQMSDELALARAIIKRS